MKFKVNKRSAMWFFAGITLAKLRFAKVAETASHYHKVGMDAVRERIADVKGAHERDNSPRR